MHRIKLSKDWKAPDGKEYKAGTVLEMDEKSATACLLEGAGVKDDSPAVDIKDMANIEATVTKVVNTALDAKLKDVPGNTAKAIADAAHNISIHDNVDDDPSYGYLPNPEKATKDQKLWALGNFAADVYRAGPELAKPNERLNKCILKGQDVIQKSIEQGIVRKGAGTGMTVAADDSMGALIPPTLNTMLLDVALETAVIRPRATVVPISGLQLSLPKVKDYDRSGALLYSGLLAYWKGEDAQLTEKLVKHEELNLSLHCLTILAYASHQAMRFSPFDLGGYLLPKMSSAITWKEEDGFINGTGAGMPLGILNANAYVSMTTQTGQTSTANIIVTKNIDEMIARIRTEARGSLCFMYNRPELYTWLVSLTRPVGTGGVMALLYSPMSIGAGKEAELAGIPCIDSEHCPAAASKGDLLLTDWSQYIIADDRQGAEIAQSMHLKFDYGQMAFRIMKYVDGQPTNTTYYTRYKGSNTTSSIVGMAART